MRESPPTTFRIKQQPISRLRECCTIYALQGGGLSMADLKPFITGGKHLRPLLEQISTLASTPQDIHRHLLLIGKIPLNSAACKTCFTGMSKCGSEVLTTAGELLEEHVRNLFPDLTLWVDDQAVDISTYVAGLAAGKDPGATFELGPMPDSTTASST